MENEKRIQEIKRLLSEIESESAEWFYKDILIKTNTFTTESEKNGIIDGWNALDTKRKKNFELLSKLQIVYELEFSTLNSQTKQKGLFRMNSDISIDTFKNSWQPYLSQDDIMDFMVEVLGLLNNLFSEVTIWNIKKC